MAANAADFLVNTLKQAGVKRMYGVVGDSLNGLTDAIHRLGELEWVHMRNEEAGAFAAGAEAHLTGKLAVCAGSCGPGNLHLINGLFDCQRSGVPVLAIAAHIPSTEIGIDYFQATHPESLFKDCSHYVELVSRVEQLPQILQRAMRVAIARHGVAVVVIPGDIAMEVLDAQVATWLAPEPPQIVPSETQMQQLVEFLEAGRDITLFCGAGCATAHDEVVALAALLKAPIVHALRAKEYLEYDNPYDVGMTGLIGFASGYKAMQACDTLLLLGTNFPYRQFYPSHARIAQIDISPEALGNRCTLHIGVLGDIKSTLQRLLQRLEPRSDSAHLDCARVDYVNARKDFDALAIPRPDSEVIHPQYLSRLVSDMANEDTVFTCDVGTPTAWAARYLKMNGKRRLIGSFNHGSMANAMLQSIGAQATYPRRQVISLSGDGGFAMMMGDLLTLVQLNLPVKVIVLNNGTLGFVELEMKASGILDTGCELKNPNFAAMAEAAGIKGIRVERASELSTALAAAFAHDGPVLVDVITPHAELIMPPVITGANIKGFGLFMLRAVLDGRARELVDLTKVNLLR